MQQYEEDELLRPYYFGHVVEERGESPPPEDEVVEAPAKGGDKLAQATSVVPLKRKLEGDSASPSPYATPPPGTSHSPGIKDAVAAVTLQKPVDVIPDWEMHSNPSFAAHGFYLTRSYPTNVKSFRYIPCTPSSKSLPSSSNNPNSATLLDPRYTIYRSMQSSPADVVRFSWEDRSTYVMLNKTGTEATTDKGFRSVRANVPVREGSWYWEFKVTRGNGDKELLGAAAPRDGAHVRLGIGRRESSLNHPIGVDAYSYGIRDKSGERIHLSTPQAYGSP
ncbi:hypothetical protein BT69DRAFT_1351797, partial [Atractiella rhizophila]